MAVYAQTMAAYAKVFKPEAMANLVVSDSDLVMTAPITTGMTNATFNINATTGGTQQAWEVRLQQTDTFTIARLGIFAYGIMGSTTGPAGTTSYRYWTYSPYQLSSAFLAVNPLWDSGALTMTLNGRQFLKNWLTNKHYQVQRTQMGPAQAITTSGTPSNAAIDAIVLGDDGMADVEPTIRFSGSWNNQITINWPNGVSPVTNYAYVGDANTVYLSISYVNMVLNGLLAQNSASILGSDFF